MGNEAKITKETTPVTKDNPAKIHWGVRVLVVVVGFLVANIITAVSAMLLNFSDTAMFLIVFVIQPVAFFIAGLVMGFWLGSLPKYEIIAVILLGFAGNFIKLLNSNTQSKSWVLFVVGLIISGLVAFGGACCGSMLKKAIGRKSEE